MPILNHFSLAESAEILRFPGGAQAFIFTLRKLKYLKGDFTPSQRCLDAGWMGIDPCWLPGVKTMLEETPVAYMTIKGLSFFDKKFMFHKQPSFYLKNYIS